jgi:hypothetical protein
MGFQKRQVFLIRKVASRDKLNAFLKNAQEIRTNSRCLASDNAVLLFAVWRFALRRPVLFHLFTGDYVFHVLTNAQGPSIGSLVPPDQGSQQVHHSICLDAPTGGRGGVELIGHLLHLRNGKSIRFRQTCHPVQGILSF